MSLYYKQYHLDNKEKKSVYHKQYRLENKEEIAKQKKQYHLDNKENISKKGKQYRLENKEERVVYSKKYSLDNKEKLKEKYNLLPDSVLRINIKTSLKNKDLEITQEMMDIKKLTILLKRELKQLNN
jgi:Zn-dependent metalloprotease